MATINQTNKTSQSASPLQSFQATSSWIEAFEYDQTNFRLTVHLKNGASYQYVMVFPIIWTQLQTAKDHSKHYNEQIKGKFTSIKIKHAKSPLQPKKINKQPEKKK
jgi:hypothetical protein